MRQSAENILSIYVGHVKFLGSWIIRFWSEIAELFFSELEYIKV